MEIKNENLRSDAALRARCIEIDHKERHRHLPSSLGCLPVIAGIYEEMLDGDIFLLSKGHSAAAWYAVLERHGFSPDVSKSHPERDPANGILCTSGSLGHGLPMAVGLAWALARQANGENESPEVHVLLGDGECMEGTTWEALHLADALMLPNLSVHVDSNGCGALGKLPANPEASASVLWAVCVRLHLTVKGQGVSFLEGTTDHVRELSEEEFERAMGEQEI